MLEDEKMTNICDLPTEVLLHVFTYLPGRQLARSRQVCARWKSIIDRLVWSDMLWREHCRKDFASVHRVARRQCKPGLLWFHIYRSLSLWPRLNCARETQDEFSPASVFDDVIKNVKVLHDGVIGVHKRGAIKYYDIDTLELSKRGTISGDYLHWTENSDTIVIMSYHLHLYILRKIMYNPNFEANTTIDDVKLFLLVDQEVYYVTVENDIYVVKLEDGNLTTNFIQRSPEPIICLGYTDRLNVLTFEQKIYSVENKNLVMAYDLEECPTLLHQLHQYNLLETANWRVIFQWHCFWGQKVPDGPLKHITVVKVYGDMVFVGCAWGVLRIYHKPYVEGVFDFYHSEPVKQYNFIERSDLPVLSSGCPILQVDVMEAEDGHTVIVAMPKKVAVLNYVHSFKRTVSLAMLPYSSTQEKMLKIDDCV